MFEHGETVVLHKYTLGEPNELGQTKATYTDIELHNVGVFPGTSREVTDGTGVRVDTGMKLVTDETVDISSQDKVTVRGTKYNVDGNSSGLRINPFTGTSFGTLIQLRRVTGG